MRSVPRFRLSTIARLINEKCEGFKAEIVEGFYNTDRKVGRLRHPGKGRRGKRLIVTAADGTVVIDHNAADPYRNNDEATREVERRWGRIWE